jgi:hypothetical protein
MLQRTGQAICTQVGASTVTGSAGVNSWYLMCVCVGGGGVGSWTDADQICGPPHC